MYRRSYADTYIQTPTQRSCHEMLIGLRIDSPSCWLHSEAWNIARCPQRLNRNETIADGFRDCERLNAVNVNPAEWLEGNAIKYLMLGSF